MHSEALIHWSVGNWTFSICQSFCLRTEDLVRHRTELAFYGRLIPGEAARLFRAIATTLALQPLLSIVELHSTEQLSLSSPKFPFGNQIVTLWDKPLILLFTFSEMLSTGTSFVLLLISFPLPWLPTLKSCWERLGDILVKQLI